MQRRRLTHRGRCASRSPLQRFLGARLYHHAALAGGTAATAAPGGRLRRQQRAVERRPSSGTDAKPGGAEACGARVLGAARHQSLPLHTPAPGGRSPDPNKGGRRIKGGGSKQSSRLRAGERDANPAVHRLCALERSREPRPLAALKSFSLRLPRRDKSARQGGCSPGPLRCASLPRPRLNQLSLASRGECDGRWVPSGSELGNAWLGAGAVSSALPPPRPARVCM